MFVAKINSKNIFFIRMSQGDTYFWHYIAANKAKAPLLKNISKEKQVDIKDYGEILDSGWGKVPPEEIRRKYPDIDVE